MNDEKILEAMSYIDDSLIEETEIARRKKGRRLPFSKIGLVAACLVILIISASVLIPSFRNVTSNRTEKSESADHENEPEASQDKEDSFTSSNVGTQTAGKPTDGKTEENADDNSVVDNENITATDTSSIAYVPMRLTVKSFTDSGFICTVYDCAGSDTFSDGCTLTVIYADNADVPEELSEGDTVYVTYSIIKDFDNTIYAHKIYYEEGETTPAFFGGKQ